MSSAIFLGLLGTGVVSRSTAEDAKRNTYILLATFILDLGLFITSIVMGSLAAQRKVFSAKQSLGAMIAFFLGAVAIPALDIGAVVWIRKRVPEKETLEADTEKVRQTDDLAFFADIISEKDDKGKLPPGWFYVKLKGSSHYYHLATDSQAFGERPQAFDRHGRLPAGWSYLPYLVTYYHIDGIKQQLHRPRQ